MSEWAIEFRDVSKRFRRGCATESLGELIAQVVRRSWQRRGEEDSFWAIRDLNFRVKAGEALGVIGPNGAGKSTVLKLLARILTADSGRILVRGRLAALIEVGAGFHGDLTGRENIFLHGAILGMSRAEIRRKFDAILAFAGLEDFVETPVKRYSSGMYARLGFSIAAHVDPDVLLVDEVLSVGDAAFRLRCMEKMRELIRGGTALVFVTHQMEQMQGICDRAMVLEGGRAAFDGEPRGAVGHYMNAVSQALRQRPTDLAAQANGRRAVEVVGVRFLDSEGAATAWTRSDERVRVEVTLSAQRPIARMALELNMRTEGQQQLLSVNTGRDGVQLACPAGERRFVLDLDSLPVTGGQYVWNVRAWDLEKGTTELDSPFQYWLGVDDDGQSCGVLSVAHAWNREEATPDRQNPEGEEAAVAANLV